MEWSCTKLSFCFNLLFLVTIVTLLRQRRSRHGANKQAPGPPGWPIIGNIFDLGSNPFRNLYKLRFKYGPVLWLRLGCVNTMVIQSAKAAEELFKKYDVIFCDRKVVECFTAHDFHKTSLALSKYGPSWRFHRGLFKVALMTNKRLDETAFLRRKCIDNMIQCMEQDVSASRARGESGELVITHYFFVMISNLMSNVALSKDILNSKLEATEFFDAMGKVTECAGKPNLADFFPFLKGTDLQGIKKNMERHLGRMINAVEKFAKERIEEKKLAKVREKKDFLDELLDSKSDDKEEPNGISTHNMLLIILELFFGGIETFSSTTEWIMAELFRSPESMRRVKGELKQVVGSKMQVEESDVEKLPYLHAVIKEGMRLHPVAPLLSRQNTVQDTNFMGYYIPKNTQVFINIWSVGRDPDSWEDPMSFKPERFLDSGIDYKGQDFQLLPFGSGRRTCVGPPLMNRLIPLTIATLLHCFDWELGSNCTSESINMKEKMGVSVRMLVPLKAIPKRRIVLGG